MALNLNDPVASGSKWNNYFVRKCAEYSRKAQNCSAPKKNRYQCRVALEIIGLNLAQLHILTSILSDSKRYANDTPESQHCFDWDNGKRLVMNNNVESWNNVVKMRVLRGLCVRPATYVVRMLECTTEAFVRLASHKKLKLPDLTKGLTPQKSATVNIKRLDDVLNSDLYISQQYPPLNAEKKGIVPKEQQKKVIVKKEKKQFLSVKNTNIWEPNIEQFQAVSMTMPHKDPCTIIDLTVETDDMVMVTDLEGAAGDLIAIPRKLLPSFDAAIHGDQEVPEESSKFHNMGTKEIADVVHRPNPPAASSLNAREVRIMECTNRVASGESQFVEVIQGSDEGPNADGNGDDAHEECTGLYLSGPFCKKGQNFGWVQWFQTAPTSKRCPESDFPTSKAAMYQVSA